MPRRSASGIGSTATGTPCSSCRGWGIGDGGWGRCTRAVRSYTALLTVVDSDADVPREIAMSEADPPAPPSAHPWLPYVTPLVTFLVLTQAEGSLPQAGGGPHPTWYPVAYAVKIAVVAAVAVAGRSAWRDLRPVP